MKVSMEAKPWKNNSGAVFEVLGGKRKMLFTFTTETFVPAFFPACWRKLFGPS